MFGTTLKAYKNARRVLSVASKPFQRSSDINLCLWKGHFFNSEDQTTREYLYHNQCFNITVQQQCSFTMLSILIRWTPYYFRFLKTKLICIGNSMICSDIWLKYHEWYFKIVIQNWNLRQFWNITSACLFSPLMLWEGSKTVNICLKPRQCFLSLVYYVKEKGKDKNYFVILKRWVCGKIYIRKISFGIWL